MRKSGTDIVWQHVDQHTALPHWPFKGNPFLTRRRGQTCGVSESVTWLRPSPGRRPPGAAPCLDCWRSSSSRAADGCCQRSPGHLKSHQTHKSGLVESLRGKMSGWLNELSKWSRRGEKRTACLYHTNPRPWSRTCHQDGCWLTQNPVYLPTLLRLKEGHVISEDAVTITLVCVLKLTGLHPVGHHVLWPGQDVHVSPQSPVEGLHLM